MASPSGYGTLPAASALSSETSTHESTDHEEQPLFGAPRKAFSWYQRMNDDVHRDWADIVLLMCYTITGLLDSASISTWGSFVSMQTGNTVYIGLGLAAPYESKRWIKSTVSLVSFCVGSFFFSRFHRFFMPRRRWVLCASFLAQMVLIVVAAGILTWGPTSVDEKEGVGWNILIPIALIAFQGCGQAVTSRALKYNALTSVVLTSIYCDLFSDAELFAAHNTERNQRASAPVLLLFGAIMGGLLAHSPIGTAGVLWIAAGLKLGMVVTWCFWRAAEETSGD